MSETLVEQWSSLATAALRAVEGGDVVALQGVVDARERWLSEAAAGGPCLAAGASEKLLELDRTLEAAVRQLRLEVALALSEVRGARAKLRTRSSRPSAPALTSRRA